MTIQHLESPIDFSNWKERASASGKLDTNPKEGTPMDRYQSCLSKIKKVEETRKPDGSLTPAKQRDLSELELELKELEKIKDEIVLSETAKTHLREVYWATRCGHKRDIYSKYFENGKLGEESGIALISELDDPDLFEMGTVVYEKCNLPRQYNDHFEGECDIKSSPKIQDIKCCWDIFTFFKHVDEMLKNDGDIVNNDYKCQGIVYMELYGESEFWLRYCLVNMPKSLLEQQLKRILWDFGGVENEMYENACVEFSRKHNYDHLPLNARVATFKIKRDVSKYVNLCRKVEKAREYLNWYSQEMFWFENPDKKPIGDKIFDWDKIEMVVNGEVVNGIEDVKISIADQNEKKEFELKESVSKILLDVIEVVEINNEIKIQDISEPIKDAEFEVVEEVSDEIGKCNGTESCGCIECQGVEIPSSGFDIEEENLIVNSILINENSKNVESKFDIEKSIEISESISKSDDLVNEFLHKIQNLKSTEEATEFYCEHSDIIDDSEYESVFFAKRDELSKPKPEAPKVTKPKSTTSSPSSPIDIIKEQEKVQTYTGNERYNISDGIKNIVENLDFEAAKLAIKEHFPKSGNTVKDLRDAISLFYNSNKVLIDRDLKFKEEISDFGKSLIRVIVDKEREKIMNMVNKM